MKRNNYKLLSSIFALTVLLSCNKTDINGVLGDNKVPPGAVRIAQVQNQNGQAKIFYSLPDNDDLLYVKAVYSIANGQTREVISSTYTNNLTVDGFADTQSHEVTLFAVNKSEVASEPVTVTVTPLTPPFKLAFDELQASATFGGVRLNTINKFKATLVIVPLVDALGNGEWVNLDNVYTQDSLINSSVRGLPPVSRDFAFYIRDRWLNRSDTLKVRLTPLEENLLNKDLFNALNLPGDAAFAFNTTMNMAWDNRADQNQWPCLYTEENAGSPQTISFSLGNAAKLSRIVIYPRSESNSYYFKGNVKDFEMWGSNDPNINGSWDSWTKLMTCNVVKPSGSPAGTDTGADVTYARAGWSFDFPVDAPKYKYLRLRNLRNWSSSYWMQIGQISVWGVY